MEHSGTPNHPWMPPGQGTAPWLPSPPDPGTGIMSLPSQHKHNPSTGAQLPHCTPSKAAILLSTLPTAFPRLPIKPSSLTTPGAPPLLLTPPTLPACHNPCSARASHHAHKPCQADAPQSRSLPNTFPLQPLAAGKSLPTPPTAASLRTLRPTGSNIFGNITLERGGSQPTGPRCYCTSLSLKRHQGRGMYMGRGWRTFQLP